MVELADAGGWSVDERPEHARETFASIERQGRESLDEMRQMLGKLRSEELDTSPQPTLADLESLLARRARRRRRGRAARHRPAPRAAGGGRAGRLPNGPARPGGAGRRSTSRCATCPMRSSSRSGVSWPTAARPRPRSPRRASASRRTAGASAASAEPAAACVLRSRLPVVMAGALRSWAWSAICGVSAGCGALLSLRLGVLVDRRARGGAGDRGRRCRCPALLTTLAPWTAGRARPLARGSWSRRSPSATASSRPSRTRSPSSPCAASARGSPASCTTSSPTTWP